MFFIISTLVIFILGILGFLLLWFLNVPFNKFFYLLLILSIYLIFLVLFLLKRIIFNESEAQGNAVKIPVVISGTPVKKTISKTPSKKILKDSSKKVSQKSVKKTETPGKKSLVRFSLFESTIRGKIVENGGRVFVMNDEITIIPNIGQTKGNENQCLYYALSQLLYDDQKHNNQIYKVIFQNLHLIDLSVLRDSGFDDLISLRKEFRKGQMGDGFLTTVISQLTKRNTVILHLHLNKNNEIQGYFTIYYCNGRKNMFSISDISNKNHLQNLLSDKNTLRLFHADYHFETFEVVPNQ